MKGLQLNVAKETHRYVPYERKMPKGSISPAAKPLSQGAASSSVRRKMQDLKGGNRPRRGKWSTAEELYCSKIIELFKNGVLPIEDGVSLRNYLADVLNCEPMRITKKFVGPKCIGKQTFQSRNILPEMEDYRQTELKKLKDLRATFLAELSSNQERKKGEEKRRNDDRKQSFSEKEFDMEIPVTATRRKLMPIKDLLHSPEPQEEVPVLKEERLDSARLLLDFMSAAHDLADISSKREQPEKAYQTLQERGSEKLFAMHGRNLERTVII